MSFITSLFKVFGIKEKKSTEESIKIPKTMQDSIPYQGVYSNGIIRVDHNRYSKMYAMSELNFTIESEQEQKKILGRFMEFLSSFSPDINVQQLIYNKSINSSEFEQKILLPLKNDSLNEYREEMNNMLIEKMSIARNNIVHEKYIILSAESDDIETAKNLFSRLDAEIAKSGQRLTGVEFLPLSIEDRLSNLYSIYNLESNTPFYQKVKMKDGNISESFSLPHIKKIGLTTKDVIGPTAMKFERDHFQLGSVYGCALFLVNLPSYMRADVITELSNMPFNMLTSVHYRSLPQDKAIREIKNKTVDINSNVVEQQKKASRNGYSAELLSPELKNSQEEVESLMNDLTQDNQKIFMVTICMTVFAESIEQLEKNIKIVQSTAERFICQVKKLTYQQELGLDTCLPFGKNFLKIERMLNTRAASAFIPFSVKELMQKNGMYYGLNAVSKSLILYNRLNAKNGNGCILGTPGSGKSFSAKREIVSVLLNTDDDVFVIDPENEYSELAKLFQGSVIRLAPGSDIHINPMDMDLDYADKDDPITLKADFIASICEAASGSRYPLSPVQKSVVDRCVSNIYLSYVDELRSRGETFDEEVVPTLRDLYEELGNQPEPEAQNMALTLERFVTGTQDSFAHKTNVNINNRFTVFNIKDIGSGMKNLGLQICLDNIWNRMISNFKKKKRTWLYCDEFHLLVQTDTSARYTQQIWKRARKWNGIPTGITQQVEDMLKTAEARAVINNCEFIMMLNLDPYGRVQMQQMLGLSNTELEYITSSGQGQGLIYNGTDIIPFIDEFPRDTKLYRAMTTKPDEVEGNR